MSNSEQPENAFTKLQEENEVQYIEVAENIKSNIEGRRGFWTLVGDIIDLYVPKVVGTLFGGADPSQKKIESSNSDSESKMK